MAENIVYLHPQPEPIAYYLRIGALHRQAERLLAAGLLQVDRIVVEGAAFAHQKDVVAQFADAGHELILDTDAAELSSVGRWSGAARAASWAHSEGALQPEHFAGGGNHDVIGMIARFAVEHGFSAVQAPTLRIRRTGRSNSIASPASISAVRLTGQAGKTSQSTIL